MGHELYMIYIGVCVCGTQLTYGCEPFASPEKSEEGKTTKKIRQQKRPWAKDDNAKPNVADREVEKRKGTTAVCVSLCVDDAAAGGDSGGSGGGYG